MSESVSNGSVVYTKHIRHVVDDKRRVQIPSKWRAAGGDTEFTLIVWEDATTGTCLRVYPPSQMAALMRKIEAKSTTDPSAVAMRRIIAKNCEPVNVDKAGRFCIPEDLALRAGISKNVMLVGAMQWFEIWDIERYGIIEPVDTRLAPGAMTEL